jgi:hypothetical protein
MMIGLLQSGTGIGRGMCLPILSRGLLGACDAARRPNVAARTGCGVTCLAGRSAAPPLKPKPAAAGLRRADELRRLLLARPAAEPRGEVESRGGWPVLLEILAGSAPPTGDEGTGVLIGAGAFDGPGTLALVALGPLGVLGAAGGLAPPRAFDELSEIFTRLEAAGEDACSLPARRLLAAAPPDTDTPLEDLLDELPVPDETSPAGGFS